MPSSPTKLDETDAAIVALLQEDGRRPYGEIGEAVGLSEAATRQRVNRLRESGLMRIVAVTDPVAVGRGVVATIGLRVSGDSRAVAREVSSRFSVNSLLVRRWDSTRAAICLGFLSFKAFNDGNWLLGREIKTI